MVELAAAGDCDVFRRLRCAWASRIIEGGPLKCLILVRNKLSSMRPYAILVTALLIILVGLMQLLVLAHYDRHFRMSANWRTALRYIVNWRTSLQHIVWDDQLFFRSIREANTKPGGPYSPAAPVRSSSPAADRRVTCTFTPDTGVGWGLTWTINSKGNATPPLVSATWTGTVRCPWQIADGVVTVSQANAWPSTTQTYGYNSATHSSIVVLTGTFSGTLPLSPIGPQLGDPTNKNGSWKIDGPPTQNPDDTWTEHGTWTSTGKPNCCQ